MHPEAIHPQVYIASFPTLCYMIELEFDLHRAFTVQNKACLNTEIREMPETKQNQHFEGQFICVASMLSNNQLKLFLPPGVFPSIKKRAASVASV